mmetsp:Transcript_2334/g.4020  ORF Transcript_2334/g.4020 Transcript_2334/m.4020 type:complete len:125 (-) Transcript_2334:19-393(-)
MHGHWRCPRSKTMSRRERFWAFGMHVWTAAICKSVTSFRRTIFRIESFQTMLSPPSVITNLNNFIQMLKSLEDVRDHLSSQHELKEAISELRQEKGELEAKILERVKELKEIDDEIKKERNRLQ